jgi:hypothetical protein
MSMDDERDELERERRDQPLELSEREQQLLSVLLAAASEDAHRSGILSAFPAAVRRARWTRRL